MMTRRKFITVASGFAASAVLPVEAFAVEPVHYDITRQKTVLPGLSAATGSLKVVHLTDLHRGRFVPEEQISHIVDLANKEKPDIVLLTGDFISGSASFIHSCASALSCLTPRIGMYAVLGNHDVHHDRRIVTEALEKAGICVLVNSSVKISEGVYIAGVDDAWVGNPDIVSTFREVPTGAATLFMTHNPIMLDVLGQPLLGFAGHTHGGQIRLGPVTKFAAYSVTSGGRFYSGWYQKEDSRIYVSRGTGVSGIPARFLCRPEIAVIECLPDA